MKPDFVAAYHELLEPGLAEASHERLADLQRRRGLYFGNRPICSVLRPRFLTLGQYRFLADRMAVLLSAFAKTQSAALSSVEFRAQLGLDEWEERLIAIPTGLDCDYPTSRMDSFFVSETELKFTEFNAETPAATAYGDALADLFLALPVMAAFERTHAVRSIPTRPGVLHALLESYWKWSGRRFAAPSIVILDWKEVPTYSEFLLFQDYFRAAGLQCVIADPREVEFRGGKLFAEGLAVDLVYKRVLLSELVERGGVDHPVFAALRAGAICMVNSPRSKLLYKKASFAVLSDEQNASLYSAAERRAIAAHIPWTRRVAERRTEFDGLEIDLVPFVLEHRERMVLKPNDEYGGKGIVLGWKTTGPEWEAAVVRALQSDYVVQDRVRLPSEDFPAWENGALAIAPRLVDTDPYGLHGAYMEGCLTRISTEDLVNVTAGGGSTVPTFLVEPR
ncbi:MAG TPA: hypothetical protein VNC50_22185 [Planctomycetia bacterium]|nr:hypothetical protein [Planctomycetia bacterium]